MLQSTSPNTDILCAASIGEAIDVIKTSARIHLVLLDLHLPGTKDFSGLLQLRRKFPRVPIAIVSSLDDPEIVRQAISFGAVGFIPKSYKKAAFTRIIGEIVAGDVYVPPSFGEDTPCAKRAQLAASLQSLTRRQLAVLQKIREGKSNREIATDLGIRETTIKAHVSDILHKLDAFSRTQLVAISKSMEFGRIASGRASRRLI